MGADTPFRSNAPDETGEPFAPFLFAVAKANPVYNQDAPLVKKLEYLAWNIRRIRRFRSGLSEPDPTEQEERHQDEWLEIVKKDPALQNDVILLLEWAKFGNFPALQSFTDAIKVYDLELSDQNHWSNNDLAALHVIMACQLFEEEGREEKDLSAQKIRIQATELLKETWRLSRAPNLNSRKVPKINWPRLFKDLGINLRFHRPGWSRKKA
jgi:hypothetical protein